jgi:succinyl-CoA synthetase beta subunit
VTQPETPTPGEILRAIGRSEKALDSLSAKIDRLDDKMDGHADAITRHELRIAALEKKDEHQQTTRAAQGVQIKGALVAGAVALLAAAGDAVITFTHH